MHIFMAMLLLIFSMIIKTDANQMEQSGRILPERQEWVAQSQSEEPVEKEGFRNVKVSGEKGNYSVSGEVRVIGDNVYYSVEDGHIEYIEEQKVLVNGSPNQWQPFNFTIQIPADKLPKNASLMLFLYQRNANDEIRNPYPVVLERL